MKELRLKLFNTRKELKEKMVEVCLNTIFGAGRNEKNEHKRIVFEFPHIMFSGTLVMGIAANGNNNVNLLIVEKNGELYENKKVDLVNYPLSYDDVDMISYFLDHKMYILE